MAKYGPGSAWLLVGGKDLRSSSTFQLDEAAEQKLEQTNGIGDDWEAHLEVGLGSVVLEATGGIYDDETAGIVDALQAKGETRQLVGFGMSGHVSPYGQKCVMLDGTYAAVWKRMAKRDGLHHAHATHKVTGARLEGVVLHGIVSESAAGNTEGAASVDNGGSSSDGLTADLHVPALTLGGYTNVVVKVRHSADDVTYADLITFAAVTSAGASERATAAGTVDRHLAVSWAYTGSGSGQSVTPVVLAARG